ncbi:putative baseplate assembly protein [Paenibacillus methanolicus]|uniref:Putative phage baseplate assembly protein n=1 Tax=Paenibacillus methanolicus TaxID=582686 RepID=A0A5S5CIP6_9BACL|nr:putative baseplate assembly protein [Paenibacillus methanolicus]TYP79666.1 putative phage baseplate assembly protein [Paenibacillus methanolicus]
MLPSPNLDDRKFEQIVQEARRAIPKWMPDWTDENAHDPGITLIEMFAWLTEMQQFYMNRVPLRIQLKFLKLLGTKPKLPSRARAAVSFSGLDRSLMLPEGTKLDGIDQRFETVERIVLHPAKLDRIIVRTDREANDYTSTNDNVGVSFFAFGADARAGNRFYMAFDRELAAGDELTISVTLAEEEGTTFVPARHPQQEVVPSAAVSWKFYGTENQADLAVSDASGLGAVRPSAWLPLDIVRDETLQLMYSGTITIRIPHPMRQVMVHPANDRGRCWICCTIEEDGYESPPRIEHIALNTVQAVQQDTHVVLYDTKGNGKAEQSIRLSSHLGVHGSLRVQLANERGQWTDLPRSGSDSAFDYADDMPRVTAGYRLIRQPEAGEITVIVEGIAAETAASMAGKPLLRVIAYSDELNDKRLIGMTNGLPGQKVAVYDHPLQNGRFRLQIGQLRDDQWQWEDWIEVDDFDASDASDRHYVWDEAAQELRFGDNERGLVPTASEKPNICIVACAYGGGSRGNVKPHYIDRIADDFYADRGLQVTNHQYARGGTERETIEACIDRVRGELARPFRAVTAEDTEFIVRRTPGVRVARVKALPLYTKGLADYPREQSPGQLTVVVVPASPVLTPKPSAGFLQTVKRHLDDRRLITTETHVIPPAYIRITVHAVIVVEPHFVDEHGKVAAALNKLLKPLDGKDGSPGWTFGRTVHKSDLYSIMNAMDGVCYIQELWLDADGKQWNRTPSGDIALPPYGLVYSGEHEIELISRLNV